MNDTSPIRAGEEINVENLSAYLRVRFGELAGEIVVEQFPSGNSNLTYLVKIGDEEFVLRRPPFGNTVKTAHDMNREYQVLSKLAEIRYPAPKPILYFDDVNIIGSEFYLMERCRGLIIRGKSPEALEKSPELQRTVCESFIENLAELHSLDYEKARFDDRRKPVGYAKRQVDGWTKRYFAAKTDNWPDLERSIKWLNEHTIAKTEASLVHNDYKFDNVMLNPDDLTDIVAVLDWEMATIGSPLMDLGTTLGYWMSEDAGEEMLNMPFNPRVLMENISRQELAEMYAERSGRDISNILFYYVFGTFKIAVIAQQIYARYVNGSTQDERFAKFNFFVAKLGKLAWRAVENKKI